MASRSWNKVELMGNLTRDPELRFTPNGAAVCTFGIATNRSYVVDGERKEDVDFHRLVAWNKLAELCNQLLKKGTRVFISGRLQYREWETPEKQKRREAEIVVDDMIVITPKGGYETGGSSEDINLDELEVGTSEKETTRSKEPVSSTSDDTAAPTDDVTPEEPEEEKKPTEQSSRATPTKPTEDVAPDEDLPF